MFNPPFCIIQGGGFLLDPLHKLLLVITLGDKRGSKNISFPGFPPMRERHLGACDYDPTDLFKTYNLNQLKQCGYEHGAMF